MPAKAAVFSELLIVLSDCWVSVVQTAEGEKRKTLCKINERKKIKPLLFLMINQLTDR